MTRILIADDDRNLRYSFRRMFAKRGFDFFEAADGESAVRQVREGKLDLVVMDVRMPGMGGLEAFEQIKALAPELPVIIMTAYGTTDTAIEAMKRGAFDYTLKPFDVEEMAEMITRAARARATSAPASTIPSGDADGETKRRLVGSSRAMQSVYKAIGQVAESDLHVLVLGESGTGKELVARAIHEHSGRADVAFVAINCAAVPESILESELFGHEKGAFTGAAQRTQGLLQASHRGTLLLDEIGDMPLTAQAKMLRFLQEGEILRVGSDAPQNLDVRVIAASNKDLEAAVADGTFRGDLFYRLNTVCIPTPPLRDHLEDLPELAAHFVNLFNHEFGKTFADVAGATIRLLADHNWPGNVRELENVLRKAVLIGHGPVLLPDHIVSAGEASNGAALKAIERRLAEPVSATVERLIDAFCASDNVALLPTMERLFIARALALTGGNQVKAAQLLGISRNTLRNRMARFGLDSSET